MFFEQLEIVRAVHALFDADICQLFACDNMLMTIHDDGVPIYMCSDVSITFYNC